MCMFSFSGCCLKPRVSVVESYMPGVAPGGHCVKKMALLDLTQSLFNRCSSVSGTGMAETTDSEADIRTDSERGWY